MARAAASDLKRACESGAHQPTIPTRLLEAVNVAKPQCPFWNSAKGCKKGNRCSLRHANVRSDPGMAARLPHISLNLLSDGSTVARLRPPLIEAFRRYFHDEICPVSHGETWQHGKINLIRYATPRMVSPDTFACAQANQRRMVETSNGTFIYASEAKHPPFLMHATDVKSALSILKSKRIFPGPGIAGEGIYGFALEADEWPSICSTFDRGTSGGYNWGASFILKIHGLVVKTEHHEVVPKGAVGKKKDQYSASPTAIECIGVVFNTDVLLGAMGEHMDAVGYSTELHSALRDVEEYLRQVGQGKAETVPQEQMTMLQNAIVSKSQKKSLNQQEEASGAASSSSSSAVPAASAAADATFAATSASSSSAAHLTQQRVEIPRPHIIYPLPSGIVSPFDVPNSGNVVIPPEVMTAMQTSQIPMMWPSGHQMGPSTESRWSWRSQHWSGPELWDSHSWDSWHEI